MINVNRPDNRQMRRSSRGATLRKSPHRTRYRLGHHCVRNAAFKTLFHMADNCIDISSKTRTQKAKKNILHKETSSAEP
jgi:hypothetical protein